MADTPNSGGPISAGAPDGGEGAAPAAAKVGRRDARRARRQRRWIRRALLSVAVVLIVGWAAVVAVKLIHAVHNLQAGVTAVNRVRGEVTTEDLADNVPAGELAVANGDFAAAHRDIHNTWLAPLHIVPWVGRQVRSVDALTGAAATVTSAGQQTLGQAHTLLSEPHRSGEQRTKVIDQLHGVLITLDDRLARVNLGPSKALESTLAAKRNTFSSDLYKLQSGLSKATGATAALSDLLSGPRTYLILGCNNAEMRAGAGMALEAGTLTTLNGALTLGSFVPTSQLALDTPKVALTGDLAALWGFMKPNGDYRNLDLSPQFDQSASLAAAMWQAQTGQKIDGVIAVDVDFLKDVLGVTGPVTAGPITVSAADVEQTLLVSQYDGLPAYSGPANVSRHEELGALAGATFAALQAPGTSVPHLASALASAVDGRHVMLWSANPTIEADWAAAGAAGALQPDDVLLSLINIGANKLDPYQQVTATLQSAPQGSDTAITVG